MKKIKIFLPMFLVIVSFSSGAFAHDHHWDHEEVSGDQRHKSFSEGYESNMKRFDDGFLFFPGGEIGFGSGLRSASLGINIGYKSGLFLIGTSLRGQVVNIDHVNYQALPFTLNIGGLSYSVIPESSNSQNDKKLQSWSLGYGMGGKFAFAQMVESDPTTSTKKEFLTLNFGYGF